jgi:3'(2'), 5'-bisphosphate nucleotidase
MSITDARLAADLAGRAGELLLSIRAEEQWGSELGRIGDQRSNALLLDALAEARPGDAVLSEESADSPERLTATRVWIIDPLDGTREFSMAGRSDWAVHVALWEAGSGLTAGAVAQPALGLIHASDQVGPPDVGGSPAGGSRAGGSRARGQEGPGRRPTILVSDSRPPAFAAEVANAVGADVTTMGSAGAKAMAVLRGDADAYLHAGGQWEWDSAAPVAVVTAAGFHASRIDGSPLLYNQPHPYLPDLLICRSDLAEPLLAAIAIAVPSSSSP